MLVMRNYKPIDGVGSFFNYFSDIINLFYFRKALNLILYLLHENSSDCSVVRKLRFLGILLHLASSEDAEA